MLTNAQLAELLADASTREVENKHKALRRASRAAFGWPEEAASILEAGRELTVLETVGPYVAGVITELVEAGTEPIEPPPERAGFLTRAEVNTILASGDGEAPPVLGDLQMHTTDSDGGGTLEEMAEAAIAYGHGYIAITDHSKGLPVAKGMDELRLADQMARIGALNERLDGRLRVLRSIEMNLSPAGEGDMDPDALGRLDLVVGSFHSELRKTEDQTERYLAALRNPHVRILGHPRGRMYGVRRGLEADWGRVFEEAERRGIAMEIDSFPARQDLDIERLEIARETGVLLAIDTDAHAPDQLDYIAYGLAAAIRARIPHERIVNTLPADDLLAWARR